MKFKDLCKKIEEAVEIGKPETTKAYASMTPGQPSNVVFTPDAAVDGVKIAAELDPAGDIKHEMGHALKRQDNDVDGDVDSQDAHTPDEVSKKGQTLHLLKKGAAERKHTKKGVAYEGYVATAPVPGDKWKDHAVMVKNTGKKQRVVILRKNIDNYPASDGWKEVRPGFKEEVELDEAMTPQQKSDFDRMMAGAMSRAAYNAKWKKPLKSDDKVIYGKNVKEEFELTEDQAADWERIQAMDKGSVLAGKEGARKKLAHLNAVLAFQKKYGKDTLKTKKEIERINQSRVAEETEVMVEKLSASDDMGKWIDDFQKSDAPQFAGKSKEERRKMAIAAKMSADRDAGVKEEADLSEDYFTVVYKDKNGKVQSEKNFTSKDAADKYAARGNGVDKVGGKYHVYSVKGTMESVEHIAESEDKTLSRLKQLVRFGLMDKSKLPLITRAINNLEKGSVTNPTERQVLFELLNELIGVVTGDDAMFAKVRMSVQNEDFDAEE